MTPELRSLIFGLDQTEGIVSLTLKDDKLSIYTEAKDGTIGLEQFDYTPFVLSPFSVKPHSERLKGEQYWKYITSTSCNKYLGLQESFQRDLWFPRQVEETAMLAEGYTYFKGRRVEDISILSFDIETNGLMMNADSKVFIISNTFRKLGKIEKKLFSVDNYKNHKDMISDWCAWVREVNPSIITGHNIISYDLPYLDHCYGSGRLNLGRDGSAIYFSEQVSSYRKDASQKYDFHNVKITGREVIDTFFLSMKYDIGRNFPTYGLKSIIEHLGLQKKDRQFYDASQIKNKWHILEEREKIKQYAIDDSDDSLKLFDLMIPASFYLSQSVPMTFQSVINTSSGGQINAMMVRSYLQEGHSIARTSKVEEFQGAISFGIPGVYKNCFKVDVASLYPSIMLAYEVYDNKKDPNGNFLKSLDYFTKERLRNKQLAKETGNEYYKGLEQSQKVAANSMYGFLGANYLNYNSPSKASFVTQKGREILDTSIKWATGKTYDQWNILDTK